MNEINLNMKEVLVYSETRPLRGKWTTELSTDLNVYINTDIEDKLVKELSDELRREMRKKKIENILKHMA